MDLHSDACYEPPPGPPPLLTHAQISQLIEHGWMHLDLSLNLKQLHESLSHSASKFFSLPQTEKERQYPQAQGTELGYYVVPDEKEYLTLRHSSSSPSLPPSCQELESYAAATWSTTAGLLYRVLADLSRALCIPLAAWGPILDGCMSLPSSIEEATPSLLRLFRYEPTSGIATPHRDNGLLTLCVGDEKGLEVWQESASHVGGESCGSNAPKGAWIDASGPTLLVGSALYYFSAGRATAANHRVVGSPKGRNSIVFALRPSTRHHIDTSPFGGEGVWDLKLIWKRMSEGRINVNAQKQIREKKAEERRRAVNAKVSSLSADNSTGG